VPELPAPFADRAQRGPVGAFFETWKLVATTPGDFFRRVRIDQPGAALLFGVIAFTVGRWIQSVLAYLASARSIAQVRASFGKIPPPLQELFRNAMREPTPRDLVLEIVAAPLIAIAFIYLSAGVFHLLLLLFRGASRGFTSTLTAVAYSTGLFLLLAVPGCGLLVAAVWFLVAVITGLGESQRCGTGKAAAAVLLPVGLVCLIGCLGLLGAAFGAASLMKGNLDGGGGTTL
jgi:hypothetical protein